VHTRDTSESVM